MNMSLLVVSAVSLPTSLPSATYAASETVASPAETESSLAELVASNKLAFVLVGLLVSVGLLGIVVLIRSYFALRRTAASNEQPSVSLPEIVLAPVPTAPERRTTADAVLNGLHL